MSQSSLESGEDWWRQVVIRYILVDSQLPAAAEGQALKKKQKALFENKQIQQKRYEY